MQMEAADVTHPKEEKDKEHAKEAKPGKEKKEKKEKKDKTKEKKEKVGEATDAAKLRAKLEKINVKIKDFKAKKQEIVTRLVELEGTAANATAPASG
uniref:Uncharacterized protein n=2 Tax=Avena sativa TaxID=4498 RepID=A0ACD5ZQ60_AVESA